MDKDKIKLALQQLRKNSKKRNFVQSIDLIISLKNFDLKKKENQLDLYFPLHYPPRKKTKVCAFVGPELYQDAKQVFDKVIQLNEFPNYKDKKAIKKLAKEFNFFVAQVDIMPNVAATFGRILGPKKKMPNPKAGCIIPKGANLKALYEKLQKTIELHLKDQPQVQCIVGHGKMKDEEIIDNILTIYERSINQLPEGENNIAEVYLKLTMSPVVKLSEIKKK